MKKKISVFVGVIMVGFILFYAIASSKMLENVSNVEKPSSVSSKESKEDEKKVYSQFEINAIKNTGVGEVLYSNQAAMSCGFSIKIKSYNIVPGKPDLTEMEGFSERYKEVYGEGEDKAALIVNVEIINESANEFFEGAHNDDERTILCLGNIWLEVLDDKGEVLDSHELFVCSNDRTGIKSKDAMIYPIGKGEKYNGQLVYIINKKSYENEKIALSIGLMGTSKANKEDKLIILN